MFIGKSDLVYEVSCLALYALFGMIIKFLILYLVYMHIYNAYQSPMMKSDI